MTDTGFSQIIRKLQQRIDRRSNDISYMEQCLKDRDTAWLADSLVNYREEQTLDKRLMGELVSNARLIKSLEDNNLMNALLNWEN